MLLESVHISPAEVLCDVRQFNQIQTHILQKVWSQCPNNIMLLRTQLDNPYISTDVSTIYFYALNKKESNY